MQKEALVIFMIILLIPFSEAQINSIEIKDVNVNENQIQILIQNNLNQDFNKETFIINNQYEIIQEETLSNFTAKFFIVNYRSGIKLNNLQVIVNDNTVSYPFTGNEDTFVINQAVSQTSELTQIESNSPISYIYSSGRMAKIQDNQIIYFSSDNLGSTSLQTDNLGNIKTKSNYLPFGKELSFSSVGKEKYQFTGKEYDAESSLNYFNARYYNPNNGKFISNDPIFKPIEGGYQYVRNNPLTITDPSGNGPPSLQEINTPYGEHADEVKSAFSDFYSCASCLSRQTEEHPQGSLSNIGSSLKLIGLGVKAVGTLLGGPGSAILPPTKLPGGGVRIGSRTFSSMSRAFNEAEYVNHGAFGDIAKYYDPELGWVTLKKQRGTGNFYERLFRNEDMTLKKLNGHGLSGKSYGVFNEEDTAYLVKEFIEGDILFMTTPSQHETEIFLHNYGVFTNQQRLLLNDLHSENLILSQMHNRIFIIDTQSSPFEILTSDEWKSIYSELRGMDREWGLSGIPRDKAVKTFFEGYRR